MKRYGKGPTAMQLQKRHVDMYAAKSLARAMNDVGERPTVDDVLFIFNETIRSQYDKKELDKLSRYLEREYPVRDRSGNGFETDNVGDKLVVRRINDLN